MDSVIQIGDNQTVMGAMEGMPDISSVLMSSIDLLSRLFLLLNTKILMHFLSHSRRLPFL